MSGAAEPGPDSGAAPATREYPFEFSGSGGEYFRIWIVNVLLTILTLGIYSAWAKVRRQRYFASSTRLAGASFAYLASPLSILKGRLLVLLFGMLYAAASSLSPALDLVFAGLVLLLIPWAVVQSLAFRAYNTSWRNLRFRFSAPWSEAFSAFVGLPILGVISLGMLYPYAVYQQRKLVVGHASFGVEGFEPASRSSDFYRVFAVMLLILMLAGVTLGGLFAVAGEAGLVGLGVAAAPFYFFLFAYYSSQIANLTYHGARLGPHRLVSRVPALGLSWIYLSNAIAMLLSLGLLVPWAEVRVARFRQQHMGLVATGSLDDFVAAQAQEVQSLGAELGEALDLDLGL